VTTPTIPIPALEGREGLERAARLQRRLYLAWRRQGEDPYRRRLVLTPVDWVLVACLTVCLVGVGLGLDRMYPVVRPTLLHALHDDLPVRPFPDCADAHAAGVFDIPRGTAAYTVDQDGDRDGLACERA
jgi:hypothetical protein